MTPAEGIYRILLRLYPAEHRQAYGQAMLQHARDQENTARLRGRRHVAALYLRLVGDGLHNAGIEHVQALRTAERLYTPLPWYAILLVVIPGLLLVISRFGANPAPHGVLYAYLMLLLVILAVMWRRRQRFPVWSLLPAGMSAWMLILILGVYLSEGAQRLGIRDMQGTFMILLNSTLAAAILITMLRGRRLPSAVWILTALLLLGGLLVAIDMHPTFRSYGLGFRYYLTAGLWGPAEALALVALGLLAARRHNVLALLVIVGGYAMTFSETVNLWGSRTRDWPGLPLYLAGMLFLFFVLAPLLFMRAKTRVGRAAALFIPAVLFLSARIIIPLLVLDQGFTMQPGDILISANVLLSLLIGWFLYSDMDDEIDETVPRSAQVRN